jgi:hypothetical protein
VWEKYDILDRKIVLKEGLGQYLIDRIGRLAENWEYSRKNKKGP